MTRVRPGRRRHWERLLREYTQREAAELIGGRHSAVLLPEIGDAAAGLLEESTWVFGNTRLTTHGLPAMPTSVTWLTSV